MNTNNYFCSFIIGGKNQRSSQSLAWKTLFRLEVNGKEVVCWLCRSFWELPTGVSDFLPLYVTQDETWIHHYIPDWNLTGQQLSLKKAEHSIVTVTLPNCCVWRKNLRKNGTIWRKIILLNQDNTSRHRSMKTMTKMYDSHFELLPHSEYDIRQISYLATCSQISKKC